MQMLQIPTYPAFQDAYIAVLRYVSDEHEYRNAPRGNASRECLNVSFALTDPRDRIVYAPARRTNIVFCFAEALWYLWGRDDLEMIGYYAPRLHKFSLDGKRLTGTAYGPRLFRPELEGELCQWERVLKLLAQDKASKRAVMTIFHPVELQEPDHPDVACTLAIQFLIRGGALHAITYMRGNDALTGLLSDVFSFTFIQEFTAHHLGVRLGSYGHHVGSMHINDTDMPRAKQIIATADEDRPRFAVPAMPPTRWAELETVGQYEEALRRDKERIRPSDLDWIRLHPYWKQVLLLFELYRQITHYPGAPVEADTLEALDPGYRWLVAHRWPNRMPASFTLPMGSGR
jgi:thymidylate synthase